MYAFGPCANGAPIQEIALLNAQYEIDDPRKQAKEKRQLAFFAFAMSDLLFQ
jgi:hypothetical protein